MDTVTFPVRNLTGAALDLAVGKAKGQDPEIFMYGGRPALRFENRLYSPSTLWIDGGPIIEREGIAISPKFDAFGRRLAWWYAEVGAYEAIGQHPLIAAMRCFAESRLGETVALPNEAWIVQLHKEAEGRP